MKLFRRRHFRAAVKEVKSTSVLRFAVEYNWYRGSQDWSWGIEDGLSLRAAVALAEDMQAAFLAGENLLSPSSKRRRTLQVFTCDETTPRENEVARVA